MSKCEHGWEDHQGCALCDPAWTIADLRSRLDAAEKQVAIEVSGVMRERKRRSDGERELREQVLALESRFSAIRELLKNDGVGEWKELMELVNDH